MRAKYCLPKVYQDCMNTGGTIDSLLQRRDI